MLLEKKVCVIQGAGGAIGGAIARGFAREETRVFLAGRTQAKLTRQQMKGFALDCRMPRSLVV